MQDSWRLGGSRARGALGGGALAMVSLLACQLISTSPPNVLLITLDTTRADRLGCYGHTAAQTPVLDALAEAGVLFENVRAHAPVTAPSHASILTGTLPTFHGVVGNLQALPPVGVTTYEDKPTVVNNVETLCSAPHIVRNGADWYRGLGRGEHAGTKLISLSGDVQRPGNYEVPLGLPLRELLDGWAGGPLDGRTFQAVTMAGLSGGFLAKDALDVTLDEPSIRAHGSFLGAGGIMVFDDRRDMVEIARQAMSFFAHESCGKCFPCRIGTQRLTERLAGEAGPSDLKLWTDEVDDIGNVMAATSACGLGVAAPLITKSLLRYFPDEVARHVTSQS